MVNSRHPISFIATDDPDHAKAFYRDVMDLDLVEVSPFALAFADGDTMLRLQIVPTLSPASHTVHGWRVVDIEKEIASLVSKGVVFETFDQLPQNATGVWISPDGHKIAWFKDPCGNVLSLTQYADP